MIFEYALQLAVFLACCSIARWIGVRQGRSDERLRCLVLAESAMNKRLSPTVRWIIAGISSGKDELPPPEGYVELDPRKNRGCNVCGARCERCLKEDWDDLQQNGT